MFLCLRQGSGIVLGETEAKKVKEAKLAKSSPSHRSQTSTGGSLPLLPFTWEVKPFPAARSPCLAFWAHSAKDSPPGAEPPAQGQQCQHQLGILQEQLGQGKEET